MSSEIELSDADAEPLIDGEAVPTKGRYSVVSLGCPKNLVDSERMLGLLRLEGYELTSNPVGTDFVVVNTCGFIEQARAESKSAIAEMIELKRRGETAGVIVSGCLAERQREALLEEFPEIDHLVGVFSRDQVTKVADRLVGHLHEQRLLFQPAPTTPLSDRRRLRITPNHFAYLKISEGCDRLCTFCAIPRMRGKHASKPIEEIVREARELAADGVRELILVAQDTTYYGIDLYGQPRLAELLTQLEQVEGLDWIRLMYLYPMHIDRRLLDTIAASEKIVRYLDMPLQHINNAVLRRMQRRIDRQQTEKLLTEIRAALPDVVLRTTMLVGFPGETEAQYDELLAFVREQRFQRLGVFAYSLEPDTPAARLPEQLDEHVKQARRDRLMEVQQEIAFAYNRQQVGTQQDVILDAPLPDEPNVWVGRTRVDAPDIDGVVYVTGEGLSAGQIVLCEIVSAEGYDLVGVPIAEPR